MKFIRKNGRIIPIKENGDGEKAKALAMATAGAVIISKSINKDSIKAKSFSSFTYNGPFSTQLQTVSDSKRFLPRAFAITRDNSVGGKRVMYASTLFQKERTGWGKKLFASVQFNAIKEGKNNISGAVISTKALRFQGGEKSRFFFSGREIDYRSAKKVIRKGFIPTTVSAINPKNKSYIGLGLKSSKTINRLGLAIGAGLVGFSLYKLLNRDKK
jgi:hypothetical protein